MTAADWPRGTVAFLFTDIEGSTALWERFPDAMPAAYARLDAILRGAITGQGGVVYKTIGDALQAAFPTAPVAVAAAVAAQRALVSEAWGALGLPEPPRVRMALHAGAVDPDPEGDYRSPVLNRLGRLLAAGHGGQVLLSQAAAQLSRDRLPEETSFRDLGQHRLRDLLEPEHTYQLVHPALPVDFPPLNTLDVARHNLPVQLTSVIGREREVGELTTLIRRPDVRLVTLSGPGGTGKTRLALQAAADLVEDFPHGVWFVPLAPLTNPALVPSTIAETLGVRESGGTPLRELLRDYLRDKLLLLVLDNFEQLLEAAPVVSELLAAPGVTVLVTSRAPLRLRGEKEVAVSPLALPRRKPPPTAVQLSQYAAVQLFIDRAHSVRADFTVDAVNAPAIAEVCHRLDGLPLAIELAAARIRLFHPRAMLARLEQRLPLLTGGARDLPTRQQTLRAAIDWSYDLLAEDEQRRYWRLSVFGGGWTLDAAEAIAGSLGSPEFGLDVLAGLERLVEHSLVRQEPAGTGEDRFAMLETIRDHGLERLEASGEVDGAHCRHAVYFLTLAERVEPELRSGGPWLGRLEDELANLRAALAWAEQADPSVGLRLAVALALFWDARGLAAEGRGWIDLFLRQHRDASSVDRAQALVASGRLASYQGDYDAAIALLERAESLRRERGERSGLAEVLSLLGDVMYSSGDANDRGWALYQEALALGRKLGDTFRIATVLNNIGVTVASHGDWDQARAL